ncbi:MAG: ATP-binding protein [bacterium]
MAPPELHNWVSQELFAAAPIAIATIDRDFNVVMANPAFERIFGSWQGRKCYEVYKDRQSLCPTCMASRSFKDGRSRVTPELGVDEHGQPARYVKHTVPITGRDGKVEYLVEMSIDVTRTEQLRQENELLFEQVPCNLALLDEELRIVRANGRVQQLFGNVEGHFCYQVFKGLEEACEDCPARRTLFDGRLHQGRSDVVNARGETVQLQVITVPVGSGVGAPRRVLEMAVDITQSLRLEDELRIAHDFLKTMIATSLDGIVGVDAAQEIQVMNQAARELFKLENGARLSGDQLAAILPEGFFDEVFHHAENRHLPEATILALDGEEIPVRLAGVRLESEGRLLGGAASLTDHRQLRALQQEKLEAERLAAVGQTVAGLAHGVKNLLTGLEGGMYLVSTGLRKDNRERVENGWQMLNRNIGRISKFVKDFLSFSKGRTITVLPCDPVAVAKEVVELYQARAESAGIALTWHAPDPIPPANLDYEGMHECLTNLVGNAIDACQMSESRGGTHVHVNVLEQDDVLRFEVEDDGVGMDYDLKQKVFTTFFTTKGLGGTGLGLLTTRKIVQEHGGSIELESTPGQGSKFTILLPRARLPATTPPDEE